LSRLTCRHSDFFSDLTIYHAVYIDSLPEVLITEFFADVIISAISSLASNIITRTRGIPHGYKVLCKYSINRSWDGICKKMLLAVNFHSYCPIHLNVRFIRNRKTFNNMLRFH